MSYTKDQLMTALKNADAAGDTEAARSIAKMIQSQSSMQPQAQPEVVEEKSFMESVGDMFTGADRETEQSQSVEEFDQGKAALLASGLNPDMQLGDLLSNPQALDKLQDSSKSKLLSGDFKGFLSDALGQFATPFTTSEDETAQITQARMPNLQRTKDEKGNEYLINPESGYSLALNKPGFSTRDAVNLGANAAAFATGGAASTIPRAIAKDAAIQAGIEGAQAGSGGEFSGEEVALSGVLGGAFKGAEELAGGAYRLATGKMSDDAARQISDIEAQGLQAKTTDVLEPQTLPGKMAAGLGDLNPLTAGAQVKQQEGRQRAAEAYIDEFVPSYDEIKKSVSDKLGATYKKAIDDRKMGIDAAKGAPLQTKELIKDINKEISKLMKNSSGTRKATADESAIKVLQEYKTDIKNATDIEELANLRTSFREAMQPDFGKKSTTKDGIIKKMYGSMTKAMDDTIRPNLSPAEFSKYKRGNALYGKTAEEVNKGRIKNILKGGEDLSPEQIDRVLLSKDSVVRAKMFRSLDENGRNNARAAIIRKIADSSSSGGEISVNRFISNLDKNKDALNTFFKGRDRKELDGLRRALEATRSAQDAAINPPTGQRLAPFAVGASALADLGFTIASTLGGAAAYKAYQSKPVRNVLLRLANTQKGTSAFEKALRDLNAALLPFAQSQANVD